MKPFSTAVVIGKFYPPHLGHHHLINAALAQTKTVYVLVCHKPEQKIPGSLRADWLRLVHPEAQVREVDDTLGDDTEAWARFTLGFLGFVPDAVFTSEDYGEPFARAMGSRHVSVDRARTVVPCSGTMVRQDPQRHLDFLHPVVRASLLPRIVLVGAESTGKTTLAEALAKEYGCEGVSEYAREYCAVKFGPQPFAPGSEVPGQEWKSEEFLEIAEEHARREDAAAGRSPRLLVVDTDAFSTSIWHERYLGTEHPKLEAFSESRRGFYALNLLCGNQIPWQQDGTRDGAEIREQMQERFRQKLRSTQRPWVLCEGSLEERFHISKAAIEEALTNWRPFGLPE